MKDINIKKKNTKTMILSCIVKKNRKNKYHIYFIKSHENKRELGREYNKEEREGEREGGRK